MAKKTWCIALTILILSTGAAWAEVNIPVSCRVKNRPPGRCGWCSIETLARYHHLEVLYELSDRYASTCCAESLEEALAGTGIVYRVQYDGEYDQALLHYAMRRGLGAVVGFRELYPGAGGHIVTLVDMNDTTVKLIDSNDEDCRTREMSLERFLYWWDGFALVLEVPPKPSSDLAAAPQGSKPSRK